LGKRNRSICRYPTSKRKSEGKWGEKSQLGPALTRSLSTGNHSSGPKKKIGGFGYSRSEMCNSGGGCKSRSSSSSGTTLKTTLGPTTGKKGRSQKRGREVSSFKLWGRGRAEERQRNFASPWRSKKKWSDLQGTRECYRNSWGEPGNKIRLCARASNLQADFKYIERKKLPDGPYIGSRGGNHCRKSGCRRPLLKQEITKKCINKASRCLKKSHYRSRGRSEQGDSSLRDNPSSF